MTDPDSPFYLSKNHFSQFQGLKKGVQWFKPQAMGINKLNTIMNHSRRKTLVQKLQNSNIPPNQIVQTTGHKTL